jgi:3-methyladenine DNA glycosylase AlkD
MRGNQMADIKDKLFLLQDLKYRDFISGLIPTIDKKRIIGIRQNAEFKKLAKKIWKDSSEEALLFLKDLPHYYYEENNLHALFIEQGKDFDEVMNLTEEFLPYIDNWATCDSFLPKVFGKNLNKLYPKIINWINSDKPYVIRYGIGMLMRYYLDELFDLKMLDLVINISSDHYYVNMMRAWYFATALAKQYDSTVKVIESKCIDTWTHNKAIQKAIESRRITDEQKKYLKMLKIGN